MMKREFSDSQQASGLNFICEEVEIYIANQCKTIVNAIQASSVSLFNLHNNYSYTDVLMCIIEWHAVIIIINALHIDNYVIDVHTYKYN